MLISKKEVLEKTGISYGQLYRWKREGLIPEEWFIKKAAATGQETFLPGDKILERIRFIKENKGLHSLDELSDMLRVIPSRKEFNRQMLKAMPEIHPDIINTLKDGDYSRAEVAFLAIASDINRRYRLNRAEISEFIIGCSAPFSELEEGRHLFLVFQYNKKLFGLLTGEDQKPCLDSRFELVKEYEVEAIANQLTMKYLKKE